MMFEVRDKRPGLRRFISAAEAEVWLAAVRSGLPSFSLQYFGAYQRSVAAVGLPDGRVYANDKYCSRRPVSDAILWYRHNLPRGHSGVVKKSVGPRKRMLAIAVFLKWMMDTFKHPDWSPERNATSWMRAPENVYKSDPVFASALAAGDLWAAADMLEDVGDPRVESLRKASSATEWVADQATEISE